MNPRSSLFSGVLIAAVVAAALGFFLLQRFAPEAALVRACVDGGLLVLLALVVYSFTRTPAHRVDDLADAILELARGNRSRRLDPAEYGELEPIARAFNDIAAHLSAQEDPNLGPIKRRPRLRGTSGEDSGPQTPPNETENVDASMRIRNLSDLAKNHSYHPELGPVRVIPHDASTSGAPRSVAPEQEAMEEGLETAAEGQARVPTQADRELESGADDDESPMDAISSSLTSTDSERNSTLRLVTNEYSRNGTEIPHGASRLTSTVSSDDHEGAVEARASNDTDIDALMAAAESADTGALETSATSPTNRSSPPAATNENGHGESNTNGLATQSDSMTPHMSDGERMRALFDAFVQAKQEHEEPTEDLEYNSFAAMVSEERVKLRQTHECRDVRFEVTVKAGEVSLLPRLLR